MMPANFLPCGDATEVCVESSSACWIVPFVVIFACVAMAERQDLLNRPCESGSQTRVSCPPPPCATGFAQLADDKTGADEHRDSL